MPDTLASKLFVGGPLFVFGALVTHLWTRFRARLSTLSWTATSTRLAITAQDTGYGKVQVLYNDHPVSNLYVVTVVLRNESTRDLTDIMVNLAFLEGTGILISEGNLIGSLKPLIVDAKFMSDWLALSQQNPQPPQISYYQTRRDYPIAVFNRGATARLDVLVTRFSDNNNPVVSLSVDHAGVQVKNRAPVTEFLGVPQSRAQLVGVILALVVTVGVATLTPTSWIVATVSLVAGLCASILGAMAIQFVRFLSKMLS